MNKNAKNKVIPQPHTSTSELQSHEILKFRDESYRVYHDNKNFLTKIEKKYGKVAVENIKKMNIIQLKRKLVEDLQPND